MQRITCIGNLTKDPEMRVTQENKSTVCNFTIAVNDMVWNPRTRKTEPTATFYRITVWGNQAENCGKFLTKGRSVAVTGTLRASFAEDENGNVLMNKNNKPIMNLEIAAEGKVEFLSNRSAGSAPDHPDQAGTPENTAATPASASVDAPSGFVPVDMQDDELPF